MKKIVLAVMTTISGLVMLFSYHTSTQNVAATSPEETGTGNTQSDAGTTTTAPSATPTASASSSASGSGGDGTYTGDAVETRWGTVQVEITVENGKITSADAVQFPSENPKDQQINAYAVPALNAEVIQAQSASIDAVSGATVTSGGYIESLQSAIDAAHLG
ncbi:MAG TPA: FMN-binding protein [Propionicimonas sp.]